MPEELRREVGHLIRPARIPAPKAKHVDSGANPGDVRPNDVIEGRTTVISPRSGSLKITESPNLQIRRAPIAEPPVMRNAIGLAVAPHEAVTAKGGDHGGVAAQTPAVALSGNARLSKPGALASPNIAQPSLRPVASVNLSGRAGINGVGPIRSLLTSAALGGPAKPVAGINGTTVRRKH